MRLACKLMLWSGILFLTVGSVQAQWEPGGSFESLNLALAAPEAGGEGAAEVSANRLRLELARRTDDGGFFCAAENLILYTSNPRRVAVTDRRVNRIIDLEKNWRQGEHLSNRLQIDRLNLRLVGDRHELTVGRQAIGFGRVVLYSPLDIIAPFAPDALDTDVRPGVDALNWSYFPAFSTELRLAAVVGEDEDHRSLLGTLATNTATVDLLAIAGGLRGRPLFGGGLAGSWHGVGVRAEYVHYSGTRVGTAGGDLHRRFGIGALELWYGAGDLTLLGEYLYNGPGVGDPEDYPRVAQSAAIDEGLTYLLGRHYLLLSPSWQVHPLLTAQVLLIWNLADGSTSTRPLLEWSLADSLAVSIFWTVTRGREPETTVLPGVYRVRSEFGGVGDSGGLFLQYYF